jgi:hypothetical protein
LDSLNNLNEKATLKEFRKVINHWHFPILMVKSKRILN